MQIGLIGRGKIAAELTRELSRGEFEQWRIVGALARPDAVRKDFPAPVFHDVDAFFALRPDLIIEVGGPQALERYGPAALEVADVWSISASALARPNLMEQLTASGRKHRHRLRFVAGAIGGLDAISAHAIVGGRLEVAAAWTGGDVPGAETFSGTMQEAALRFEGINSLAAAALAGAGLNDTTISYVGKPKAGERRLHVTVESIAGRFTATSIPTTDPELGPRIVAASLLSALRREAQVIWCG